MPRSSAYLAVLICLAGILCAGCAAPEQQDEPQSPDQAALLDSLDVPEHVRQLDSLTVFDPAVPPRYQIRFTERTTYEAIPRSFAPIPLGGHGSDIAVDDSGMVYRTDRRRRNIRILNPDGSLRETIGRQGRGPGEFLDITSILIHRDQLYAYDPYQTRIQVFSLRPAELDRVVLLEPQEVNGENERTSSMPASSFYPFGEGQFLAGISNMERDGYNFKGYYVLNSEGNLASELVVDLMQQRRIPYDSERGATSLSLPAGRTGIMDVASDGTVYHANTGEFLIRVYKAGQGYQRAIWYPFENDPIEPDEIIDLVGQGIYNAIPQNELPDTWPALESLFVDDENRIWVSTIPDNKDNRVWWVLSGSGELLARFTWSSDDELQLVKDGHLYVAVDEGENMDVDRSVVRYEFTLASPNEER